MEAILELNNDVPWLGTALLAVLILVATGIVEHILFRIVRRIGGSDLNPLPASSIFANILRVLIWIVGIAIMLRVCFNYDAAGLFAALGVGGIAVSLGLQDTLSNLIGGLQVSVSKLVKPGDYIEVLNQQGRVIDVTWRHTEIKDSLGRMHVIPNALINKNSLVFIGDAVDVRVPILVPHETDLDAFSAEAVPAVEAALEGFIGERGVRIEFSGEAYGGLTANVVAHAMRSFGPPEKTADVIARAIDPALKKAGYEI